MNHPPAVRGPAAPAAPDVDVHHGVGGSYQLDPVTGVRTLVARTAPSTPHNPPDAAPAAPASEAPDAAPGPAPEVAAASMSAALPKKPNASKGR